MPGEPTTGYNCAFCGQWVQTGVFHQCWSTAPMPNAQTVWFKSSPQSAVYSGVDYEHIRQIIREEIEKALADKERLDRWVK